MFIDIDYNKRKRGYKLYLAQPNKKIITNLSEAYGPTYNFKLGNINELSFNIPYYIEKEDIREKNENVDLIREKMYLKIKYNGSEEWLIIDEIEDNGEGDNQYMTVTAFSNAFETSHKRITGLELGTVNPNQYYSEILNDTDWSIGNVDSTFVNMYRSFEISDSTVLQAILEGGETFGAVLNFDSEEKKINLISLQKESKYRGLKINYKNFLQSINRKRTVDKMVTRLYVYGADGLTITDANPTGMPYLEDFAYFLYPFERDENKNVIKSSHYMSDELAHAILDLNELSEEYAPQIQQLQTEIDESLVDLVQEETNLSELRFERNTIKGLLDIAKATGDTALIQQRQSELDNAEIALSSKEELVSLIKGEIDSLELQITNLQESISVTSFTKELRDELNMYIIEDEFRDERYIDDEELYDDALIKFNEFKSPSVVINASIDNIVDSLEEEYYNDKIVLGDQARITDKDMNVDVKSIITELVIDIDEKTCDMVIANEESDVDGYDKILSILYSTQSATSRLELNKHKWDSVTELKTEVDQIRDGEIDAVRNRIKAGVNESVQIDDRGIVLSNPDYPNEMVIMQAGVIALTKDGGENWSTSITPDGVVADTIIGKLVASNNLLITNDSGTFRIDSEGLEVDMDSIKITSGSGETPQNMIDSWNKVIITMDEFADDNLLNPYEKNQIERQWNSIVETHSSMVTTMQNAYGPETEENPYPVEYERYIKAYEDLRVFLNETPQSDGHTVLNPSTMNQTTPVDGALYHQYVSNYQKRKDLFQTEIPLDFAKSAIKVLEEGIFLNYVRNGEIATQLNLNEQGVRIDGKLLDINGQTVFRDSVTMDAGLIKSKDGAISIDLNAGIINLGRPITINSVPVATTEDVENSIKDTIVSVDVEYAKNSSIDIAPVEGWNTNPPAWENGKYIWSRTTINYKDNSSTQTEPVNITGAKGASGSVGSDGRSIEKIQEQYYHSNSRTELIGDYWVNTPPVPEKNKYIWTRSIITYKNPSGTHTTEPISVSGDRGDIGPQGPQGSQGEVGPQGPQGLRGPIGEDGESSYTHIAWANNITGTSGFDKNSSVGKTHIGIYIDNNVDSSSDPSKYNWTEIKGDKGDRGEKGLAGAKGEDGLTPYTHFAWSNSSDGTDDFTLMESVDRLFIGIYTDYEENSSTDPSKYHWTRIKGDKGDTGPQGATGSQGPRGPQGTSVDSITEYYLATSSSSGVTTGSAGWSTTMQTMTTTNKYLWNYEKVTFSDGSSQNTIPVIMGVYGNTGPQGPSGPTGEEGRAIVGIEERYLASSLSSGVTRSTSGWTASVQQTTTTNRYLWNYEIITWSKAPTTTYVEPIIIGVHGATGPQGPSGPTGSTGPTGPAGRSITSVSVEYYLSTSQTTQSGGSWVTNPPNWIDGRYMWTRTRTKFSSGSDHLTDPVNVTGSRGPVGPTGSTGSQGPTGSTGPQGRSVSSLQTEYYLSSSRISLTGGSWSTNQPTWEKGKYMWTRVRINLSNPSGVDYTDPNVDASWEAIDGIEVGGRNLMRNTGFKDGIGGWSGGSLDVIDGETVFKATGTMSESAEVPLECNQYYTTTIDIYPTVDIPITRSMPLHNYFRSSSSNNGGRDDRVVSKEGSIAKANEWTRITEVVKTNENVTTYKFHVYSPEYINSTSPAYIKNIKLERGNKATPWTEAPEDTDDKINQKSDQTTVDEVLDKVGDLETVTATREELGEVLSTLSDYKDMLEANEIDVNDAKDDIADLLGRLPLIENNLGEWVEQWNFLETYVRLGEEGLLIQEMNGSTGIRITTNRIDFLDGRGEPVAYITNQVMRINRGIFVDSAQIGQHKIETIAGGHTIWQWMG